MADPKPDGRVNIRRPTRSRMAESTSGGRPEAGWPNQHQAADPKPDGRINIMLEAGWPNQHQAADPKPNGQINIGRSPKPIGRLRLKANGRINIRRSEATSGGRRSRATDPTTGHGRTQAEVKRPELNGRSHTAEADARQRSSCRCPHQQLLKPAYRGARWHYLHGVHYATAHASGY